MTQKQQIALRKKLTKKRTQLGYSLRHVADRLGIHNATLMRWERGDHDDRMRDYTLLAWQHVMEALEREKADEESAA